MKNRPNKKKHLKGSPCVLTPRPKRRWHAQPLALPWQGKGSMISPNWAGAAGGFLHWSFHNEWLSCLHFLLFNARSPRKSKKALYGDWFVDFAPIRNDWSGKFYVGFRDFMLLGVQVDSCFPLVLVSWNAKLRWASGGPPDNTCFQRHLICLLGCTSRITTDLRRNGSHSWNVNLLPPPKRNDSKTRQVFRTFFRIL